MNEYHWSRASTRTGTWLPASSSVPVQDSCMHVPIYHNPTVTSMQVPVRYYQHVSASRQRYVCEKQHAATSTYTNECQFARTSMHVPECNRMHQQIPVTKYIYASTYIQVHLHVQI